MSEDFRIRARHSSDSNRSNNYDLAPVLPANLVHFRYARVSNFGVAIYKRSTWASDSASGSTIPIRFPCDD